MAILIIILTIVLAISLVSEVHALGLWIFMMITHGLLVDLLGPSATHLPMYAGVIIMAITIARRKWTGMQASIWLLIYCLIAFIALAALLGRDPGNSIAAFFLYSKAFVLAIFIGGVVKDDSQVRTVTLYCLIAVLIGGCIAVYQHFTGSYTIDFYDTKRAAGLTADPNDTAMLLLTGLPLALYWFSHSDNLYMKVVFAGIFIITVSAITLTQSRGGGVALALILILLYLRRPTIKALSVGLILVGVGLLFVSTDYWERMSSLTTVSGSEDNSLNLRFRYLEVGVGSLLRYPVFGIGMGNFAQSLAEADSDFEQPDAVAHNMYLEFFVENGIFAGLLFLILLGSAVINSRTYDKYNQLENSVYGLGFCLSMALMAIMTAGLFLSVGRSSVLWFLVGIGLAFSKMIRSAKGVTFSRVRETPIDH